MSRSTSRTQVRTSGSLSQTLRIRGRRACPWPSFLGRRWSVPTAHGRRPRSLRPVFNGLGDDLQPFRRVLHRTLFSSPLWALRKRRGLVSDSMDHERSFVHGRIHPTRVRFCRDSQDACAGLSCYYKSMAEGGLRI